MPFEPLEFKPMKEARASIGYQRYRREGKNARQGLPVLIVGIPAAIAKGFKLKDGEAFGLAIGQGKDAGRARITKAAGGVAPRKLKKGSLAFRFGFVPMLGYDAAAKEFVDATAIDGGFELVLPAWFKRDAE